MPKKLIITLGLIVAFEMGLLFSNFSNQFPPFSFAQNAKTEPGKVQGEAGDFQVVGNHVYANPAFLENFTVCCDSKNGNLVYAYLVIPLDGPPARKRHWSVVKDGCLKGEEKEGHSTQGERGKI